MRLIPRRKPAEIVDEKVVVAPAKCRAITRAGRPCRLPPAFPGAGFCLLHLPAPPVRTA